MGLFSKKKRDVAYEKAKAREKEIKQARKRLKKAGLSSKKAKEEARKAGKVRKGAKGAEVTKGGTYVQYSKKTAPAAAFGSAFASARKAGKKTFMWDGRKYSTARADDKKKVTKAKVKGKTFGQKSLKKAAKKSTDVSGKLQFKTPMKDVMDTKDRLAKQGKYRAATKDVAKGKTKVKKKAGSFGKDREKKAGSFGKDRTKKAGNFPPSSKVDLPWKGVRDLVKGIKNIPKNVKSWKDITDKNVAQYKKDNPDKYSKNKMEEGGKVENYSKGGKVGSNPYGWPSKDSRKR